MLQTLLVIVFLFSFGIAIGSFIGAMIWRLHDFRENPSAISRKMWRGFWGFRYDKTSNSKKTSGRKIKLADKYRRSYCESCNHALSTMDLIPFFSWIILRGKCRYCDAKIGTLSFIIEISLGLAFVVSYLFWPISHESFASYQIIDFAKFVIWLIIVALMHALFFYDARWKKLPNLFMYPLIVFSLIFAILSLDSNNFFNEFFARFVLAAIPVFGVYLALFLVSKGKWIGFGDVKFGIVVAFLCMDFRLALVVLFFANYLGSVISIAGMAMRKLSKKSQIAFGPFLIIATYFVVLFSLQITEFFNSLVLF